MVVGSGLSSNFDPVALADDIERIGYLLENPPVEFAVPKFNWTNNHFPKAFIEIS